MEFFFSRRMFSKGINSFPQVCADKRGNGLTHSLLPGHSERSEEPVHFARVTRTHRAGSPQSSSNKNPCHPERSRIMRLRMILRGRRTPCKLTSATTRQGVLT